MIIHVETGSAALLLLGTVTINGGKATGFKNIPAIDLITGFQKGALQTLVNLLEIVLMLSTIL
jgi:hypothetical protein